MNGVTPRRNTFFASLKRVIDENIRRTHNFEENFKQSYSRHKRKMRLFIKTRTPEIMNAMIQDYETNYEAHSCKCRESRLISSMLDTKIPCSHLLFLGDDFPKITAPKIELHNSTDGDLINHYNINSTPRIQINSNYITRIQKYVCKVKWVLRSEFFSDFQIEISRLKIIN